MKVIQAIKKQKGNTLVIMVLFVLVLSFILLVIQTNKGHVQEEARTEEKTDAFEVLGPSVMDVTRRYVYVDGEVIEDQTTETIWAMEDFWAMFDDWTLVTQSEDGIIFEQEIDDISPALKVNGYFGITEHGVLSIFEGVPQDAQIIQSFYQIDTKKLKSQLHMELAEGIPVENKEHFEEVLEVIAEYKVGEY
ncbi:BofC C-terminal domain-containing protein [Bacillus sp. FJAT-45037]|uniref:BofC C-terminal domain-containing protein n=1 Tax=Bacillus sp. FJAT-45037 TaxID=2011007 RepID=UPI000C247E3A|nr:BofC C-terminal domain-containing protein [Bacillus sp. FJAT-45037]